MNLNLTFGADEVLRSENQLNISDFLNINPCRMWHQCNGRNHAWCWFEFNSFSYLGNDEAVIVLNLNYEVVGVTDEGRVLNRTNSNRVLLVSSCVPHTLVHNLDSSLFLVDLGIQLRHALKDTPTSEDG